MTANNKQIGGEHYKKHGVSGEQHWDRQYRLFGPGYFIGCATKYIERYKDKNGKQDLEKAIHFIEKLIELEYPEPIPIEFIPNSTTVAAMKEARSINPSLLGSAGPAYLRPGYKNSTEQAYEGDATSGYVDQDR